MKNQARLALRRKVGFGGGVVSFAACYAAASSPIPLYENYSQLIGLSNADMSFSSALYFIGTVISLLLLARLSDYWGRRPMILGTLLLSSVGCFLFVFMESPGLFLLGRFIQGVSCGLGASCMAAYIIDTAPAGTGTMAVSSAPMIGLAAGSLGAGIFVEYFTISISTIFLLLILFNSLSMFLVACGIETVRRKTGWLRALKPNIGMPESVRSVMPAAMLVFAGTWAVGGLYQAFSASMAEQLLGGNNVMAAAVIFAVLQAPNVLGSKLAGHLSIQTAQKAGMTAFLLSTASMLWFLQAEWIGPFLIATAAIGIAWGLAYTGSMQGILAKTTGGERAGVLSMIYIISYGGAAVPSLVLGKAFGSQPLLSIVLEYCVLTVMAWCFVIFLTRRKKESVMSSGEKNILED